MTLDEAIKRMKARVEGEFCGGDPEDEDLDDMRLGIEALKRFQDIRRHPGSSYNSILPGETKE